MITSPSARDTLLKPGPDQSHLLAELEMIALELSEDAKNEILHGASDEGLQIETALRLRYAGTDSSLTIVIADPLSFYSKEILDFLLEESVRNPASVYD